MLGILRGAAMRRMRRTPRSRRICAPMPYTRRSTEREARDYLHYYVHEKGDWEAVENLTRIMGHWPVLSTLRIAWSRLR